MNEWVVGMPITSTLPNCPQMHEFLRKKVRRSSKVTNAKKSDFDPLLLVADWSTQAETMLPPKLPTGTTTYPNGVEIEVLLRKL
ncbi:MAG: hypothetical protein GY820_46710 [Gammaproteobacteria bacterium]|nr:hypothetical protein [Gammaproteobacteria bacterium]